MTATAAWVVTAAAVFCAFAHFRFARAARAYARAISTWTLAMTAAKDAGVPHDDIPRIEESEEAAAASRAVTAAEPLCHISRTVLGVTGIALVLLVLVDTV